jgi:ribulose 1,5-bisphosphate synthetase/thiazole synthase
MDHEVSFRRKLETRWTADVLVVGGGPAGIGAAVGAARHGADTLIVERHGFFGGVASFGVGMRMNQMRPFGEPRSVVHEMMIDNLCAYGPRAAVIRKHAVLPNVEYLRASIFDTLEQAGCKYLVHAQVVDATVERNRVTGVVLATKQGLARIAARIVIDCTGDADVAYFAGAETMNAAAEGDELSPMTLNFDVTSADISRVAELAGSGELVSAVRRTRASYPRVPESFGLSRFSSDAALNVNHGGTRALGSLDGTRIEDITQAESFSRRQVIDMVRAMNESGVMGSADLDIIATGAQVGVRETRRVKGAYVLTESDAKEGSRFDDAVAWRSGFLDIGFVRYERMKVHEVPYRAIVPETVDGLLTAGRCISATHVAASAGKSMGNCVATGHAAGVAAAISCARGLMPRDLQVGLIQDVLRDDGVDVPFSRSDQTDDDMDPGELPASR